jgi:uncharacterized protein
MTGAPQADELDWIAEAYSLRSMELAVSHLEKLLALTTRYRPILVSDHLSWSAIDGAWWPALLPLPYTEKALEVFVRNVDYVQTQLARQILIENPSRYLNTPGSDMSEAEFLGTLLGRSGCGVLLDINNLYVGARNVGNDADATLAELLDCLPTGSVQETHLAGHQTSRLSDGSELRVDDHGSEVCPEVWRLYEKAIVALGPCPTLIEWDTRLPEFAVLQEQAQMAQRTLQSTLPQAGPEREREMVLLYIRIYSSTLARGSRRTQLRTDGVIKFRGPGRNKEPALIMRRRFPCLATSPSSWCSGSMRNPYAPPARAYNRVWILWKSLAKSCSPSGRCTLCGYGRRITGHKQPGGGRQVPQ